MNTPLSPERIAEIRSFAGVDHDPGSYTQALTLALRDTISEVERLHSSNKAYEKRNDELHIALTAAESLVDDVEDAKADLEMAEKDHEERAATFATVLEELHHQAHGYGASVHTCLVEPCTGLYRVIPNAVGALMVRTT